MGFYEQRILTAVHEASHAVACCAFGGRVKVATIRGDARRLGHVCMTDTAHWTDHQWIVAFMAGPIGECRHVGRLCDFRHHPSDQNRIISFVRNSPFNEWEHDTKTPEYLKALGGAYSFVNTRWNSICAAAQFLLAHTSATHDEIAQFV